MSAVRHSWTRCLTASLAVLALLVAGGAAAETPDSFVEYVESAGAAYVDTGIKPVPSTFRATITLAVTQLKNDYLFGVKNSSWASSDSVYVLRSDSQFRVDWIGSQSKVGSLVLNEARLTSMNNI